MFNFRQSFKVVASSVVLVSGALLAGCSDQSAETAKDTEMSAVKVGMSGTYYPFAFMDQGHLKGFEVDVWKAIGQRIHKPVEFVTAPFSGLFGMLEAGKVDTISNQITLTPERTGHYAFSQPYVYAGAQITVRNDNDTIHGIQDLNGKRVAVNLGSNYEHILRQRDPDNQINIITYDTGIEQDVVLGRSDAFVMDRTSVLSLIKKSGLPLKLVGKPIDILENALPFKNTEEGRELRAEVDTALNEMRADGTLATLSEQWFGTDITSQPDGEARNGGA